MIAVDASFPSLLLSLGYSPSGRPRYRAGTGGQGDVRGATGASVQRCGGFGAGLVLGAWAERLETRRVLAPVPIWRGAGPVLLKVFAAVAVVVGALLNQCGPEREPRSAEPELIEFSMHDHIFQVPENYLSLGPGIGDRKTIGIWLLWPEKRFYEPALHWEFWKATGEDNRRLSILFREAGPNRKSLMYRLVVQDAKPGSRPEPSDHGLYRWPPPSPVDQEQFTDAPDESATVRIRCDQDGRVPWPLCMMDFLFLGDLSVQASFRRPWLGQWIEMKEYSEALIRSLRAGNASQDRPGDRFERAPE